MNCIRSLHQLLVWNIHGRMGRMVVLHIYGSIGGMVDPRSCAMGVWDEDVGCRYRSLLGTTATLSRVRCVRCVSTRLSRARDARVKRGR